MIKYRKIIPKKKIVSWTGWIVTCLLIYDLLIVSGCAVESQGNTHPWWGRNSYFLSHDDDAVLSMLSHSHGSWCDYSHTEGVFNKGCFSSRRSSGISPCLSHTHKHTLGPGGLVCYSETWPPLTWHWGKTEIKLFMSRSLEDLIMMYDVNHPVFLILYLWRTHF